MASWRSQQSTHTMNNTANETHTPLLQAWWIVYDLLRWFPQVVSNARAIVFEHNSQAYTEPAMRIAALVRTNCRASISPAIHKSVQKRRMASVSVAMPVRSVAAA